ncbi:MAG: DNA-directed RNA polymerase subunit L [Candidatus Woesearchaeota archaeon]|nr:DNA-directed RNA polymerase subunit L [Candidatus Woesearchaeota archaeon]
MEIKVLEENKNKLMIEISGEGHTLSNALREELQNDKSVKIAGYNIRHPMVGKPKFIVETEGRETAREALEEAAKRLKKEADKFRNAVDKELK